MQATVPVGDDQIWAQDSGGDGPAVVLLHSGLADSRYWDLVWPLLAEEVRAVRYDARGYGKSPLPTTGYRQVDDLRAVLDHFGLTSVHLVGCSMGGQSSIELALAGPDQISSLTLLCPGISGYGQPSEPELDAEEEAAIAAGDDAVIQLVLRQWAAAGTTPFILETVRSAIAAWQAQDTFCRPEAPVFDRLSELRMPTVLMVGDLDRAPLIASNEAAAAAIPGCELIKMPGVDHFPAVREPELVAQVVLRQCARARAGH